MSGLARSTYYRRPDPARAQAAADAALRATIEAITGEFPGYGYRRVTHELRRRGTTVNHKRVARVMRASALAARMPAALESVGAGRDIGLAASMPSRLAKSIVASR